MSIKALIMQKMVRKVQLIWLTTVTTQVSNFCQGCRILGTLALRTVWSSASCTIATFRNTACREDIAGSILNMGLSKPRIKSRSQIFKIRMDLREAAYSEHAPDVEARSEKPKSSRMRGRDATCRHLIMECSRGQRSSRLSAIPPSFKLPSWRSTSAVFAWLSITSSWPVIWSRTMPESSILSTTSSARSLLLVTCYLSRSLSSSRDYQKNSKSEDKPTHRNSCYSSLKT